MTFRVLVVAPFHATADTSTSDPWTTPVVFTRQGFDEAMAGAAPALVVELAHDRKARVALRFAAMRSFRPDALVEEVEELRAASAGAAKAGGAKSLLDDLLDAQSPPDARSATLASILAHPEVRSVERAWRGLHFLVARVPKDADVVVEAIHAHHDDVEDVLARVARRGEVIDLVVVDHALGASARDVDRLEKWAALGEAMGAPVIANALPELLGFDDLAKLARTQSRVRSNEDPRAQKLRSAAAKDATRWVSLALNGALARPRWEGPVLRHPETTLAEKDDLFLGPAVMVASLAIASFAREGWACALTGPTNGILRELPVRTIDGSATPLEAAFSTEAAAECAAAGVAVFCSATDKDVAILPHAPVLYRGASKQGGAAPPAAVGIADQIFVARVVQALMELAAAIPSDTPDAAAREVVLLALTEMFASAPKRPTLDIHLGGTPRALTVTLHPKGFLGVRLEELTLGAPLAI